MKKFFVFLGKLLGASFLWFLGATISMIIIAILDPLSGVFIIIPDLGSEISPFALVHIIALAQVCIYYAFFYSSESTRSFSKKYGLFILAAYIASFSIYFIDTGVSFYFVLWPGCIFILAIYFLYFLWKEIAPKIRASDSYKLSLIESNKHGLCGFIWTSILGFDLLWFWKSDKPLKQKLAQFFEILLYVMLVSFLLFFLGELFEVDNYLFDLIATNIHLDINGSLTSLQDAIKWASGQHKSGIDGGYNSNEIYKWKQQLYIITDILNTLIAVISAFAISIILKNRRKRLLSLILFTIISGIIFGIYGIYCL
ncbi:MAG: hypothetical protein U0518_04795 [Candidatus Gracilibacteria bacterium]